MPSQYASAPSFYRVPSPALVGFLLHKTPKFIHLSIKAYLNFQIFQFATFFISQKIWISFWWSFFLIRMLPCFCLSATPDQYLEPHYYWASFRLFFLWLLFCTHYSGILNENNFYNPCKTNAGYLQDFYRFSVNPFRHNAYSEFFDNEPYLLFFLTAKIIKFRLFDTRPRPTRT